MRRYYVYILSSKSHRIYIGVTNNLQRRLQQHRRGEVAFTARYRMTRLVHVEITDDVMAAIRREKELKGWRREKKVQLIEKWNPTWEDLATADSSLRPTADPSLRSG